MVQDGKDGRYRCRDVGLFERECVDGYMYKCVMDVDVRLCICIRKVENGGI